MIARRSRAAGEEHAELATLGRLERPERAAKQHQGVDEHVARHGRDPGIDHVEQFPVVHQHGAAAGEEAFEEARPVGRRGSGRERPAHAP